MKVKQYRAAFRRSKNGKFVTRNVSSFKPIQNVTTDDSACEDDDDANQIVVTDFPGRRYPVQNHVAIQRYGQNIYDT